MMWNMFILNNKDTWTTSVVLLFLQISLNIFQTFACFLYCWLWTVFLCWKRLVCYDFDSTWIIRSWIYIRTLVRVDFNKHHEMRSTSDFWCQQFIMLALIFDIFYLNHRFDAVVILRGKLVSFPNVKNVV